MRGAVLMAFSNTLGSMLLSTGNKSELAVGYCTLYGDMCGGLAVISDVPKTLVYDLARYVNRRARNHSAVEHHEGAERRAEAESDRPGHAAAVRDPRSRNRGLRRARRGRRDDCALRARSRRRRGHRPHDHAQRVQAAAGGAGPEDHLEGIRRRPAVPHRRRIPGGRRSRSRGPDRARFMLARLRERLDGAACHPLRPFAHRPPAPRPHRQRHLRLGHRARARWGRCASGSRTTIASGLAASTSAASSTTSSGWDFFPMCRACPCSGRRRADGRQSDHPAGIGCARPPAATPALSTGATARARESRATPATSDPNCATTVVAAIAGWGPGPDRGIRVRLDDGEEAFDDARLGLFRQAPARPVRRSARPRPPGQLDLSIRRHRRRSRRGHHARDSRRGSPGVDRPPDSARAAPGPGPSRRCSCTIRSCAARTARN